MDKNASAFEKVMSVGGLGASGLMSYASWKETGVALGADSKLGRALMGNLTDAFPKLATSGTIGAIASAIPTAALISTAATVIPAVVNAV
jgi:hypothetical protein